MDIFNTGSSLAKFITTSAREHKTLHFCYSLNNSKVFHSMCLWLVTACLGLLPANPAPPAAIVIVQGVPTAIIQPTPAPTTAATTSPTSAATMAPTTTTTTTMRPTTGTSPPTTAPPATSPTTTARPATPPPTTAPPATSAPTTAPPATSPPATAPPATSAPTTAPPATSAATTAPPATTPPTTAPPATSPPTTAPPATSPPTTAPPATTATTTTMTTVRPTTGNNNINATVTMTITVMPNLVLQTNTLLTPIISLVTNTPSTSGEFLSVLLCNNPEIVCMSNPNENAAGSLQIDPRLGTTPAESAALQLPPITGYSAQVPYYDTAVKFPREKRDISSFYTDGLLRSKTYQSDVKDETEHRIRKRQSCRCVTAGTCIRVTNGAGLIDVRIVSPVGQCPTGQEYCCGNTTTPATTAPATTATPPVACGTLQTVPATSVAPAAGQANFGEYPWQALILTNQNDYLAGGVLINQLHVLTVIHRISRYIVSGTTPNVKVRLGEWDAGGTYEPIPFKEYSVLKVFIHAGYVPASLQNDIAVLRLSASVPFTPMNGSTTTINRACLPPTSTSVYTGQRCWVSGWGKDLFGLNGQYQKILKEVDVPIVASATCQTQMQTARLGATFVLDTSSFICAGGEANKDSCTGDGGSGLVCQVNGQWVLVGLVAWGLGCANANVPGAYVNVAAFLPWIQQQLAAA